MLFSNFFCLQFKPYTPILLVFAMFWNSKIGVWVLRLWSKILKQVDDPEPQLPVQLLTTSCVCGFVLFSSLPFVFAICSVCVCIMWILVFASFTCAKVHLHQSLPALSVAMLNTQCAYMWYECSGIFVSWLRVCVYWTVILYVNC